MTRKSLPTLALLTVTSLLLAADEAPPKPEEKPRLKASDKSAITAHMNKEVVVEGTIADATWSTTGKVMNIRFADTDDAGFIAAIFQRNKAKFDNAFDGDATKSLTGAKVQLTGKLGTFREQPQIILDTPAQIKILSKPESPKDASTEKAAPKE
jgi:DNA/RNA endonuclease YhcR with UshA esterase domain